MQIRSSRIPRAGLHVAQGVCAPFQHLLCEAGSSDSLLLNRAWIDAVLGRSIARRVIAMT
jgi:hypothetical protein